MYTKGEWQIDLETPTCVEDVRGHTIAIVYDPEHSAGVTKTAIANAHLIAQAPRLYEALEKLNKQLLGANIPFSQTMFDAKKNAREAIAEVEGI